VANVSLRDVECVVTWPEYCTILLFSFCIGGVADRWLLLLWGYPIRRYNPVIRLKARVHGRHIPFSLLCYKLILGLKPLLAVATS
jgi:hypothetical protein